MHGISVRRDQLYIKKPCPLNDRVNKPDGNLEVWK